MGYAIRKDGLGWRAVDGKADLINGEVFSEIQPEPNADQIQAEKNNEILVQIAMLEASQSRAVREVLNAQVAGINPPVESVKKLTDIDSQILALRKTLK